MSVGEQKDVSVAPEEGYGMKDPQAFVQVAKTQLPEGLTPQVGQVFQGTSQEGRPFQARIHEIAEESVTLDLNHPLAGKILEFTVKVVDVSAAP